MLNYICGRLRSRNAPDGTPRSPENHLPHWLGAARSWRRLAIPWLFILAVSVHGMATARSLEIATGETAPATPAGGVEQPPLGDVALQEPPFVYKSLQSKPEFRRLAIEIRTALQRRHYTKLKIDDRLSIEIFNNYLQHLDPNRSILWQSDVERLRARHQTRMDDVLKNGDFAIPIAIFNLYREKALKQVDLQLRNLPSRIEQYDFSRDEDLLIDRDGAPWPVDEAEAADLWRKQIKNQAISMLLDEKPAAKIPAIIGKRLRNQRRELRNLNSQDAFNLFMRSYTELYDSHTNYMSKSNTENFNISLRLSLEGIGAVLSQKDGYTEVISISPGGPAKKQGELAAGDRIIAVAQEGQDYEEIIGWRLDEVITRIRGPRGTKIHLRVLPKGKKALTDSKTISIVRDRVKLEKQAARKKLLEIEYEDRVRKIGVIDLPSFYLDFRGQNRRERDYRSSVRDVIDLLDKLNTENVDALIFDLRDNGGGSLQEANNMVGLFIESGPTVQVRRSNGQVIRHGKLRRSPPYFDKPMAVLINRLSASASEIFSAAIQDYGRGVVIGTGSYGKGTVQSLVPLSSGQLKMTDAKFYRVSGGSTQLKGVLPDVRFPPLHDARNIGEAKLDHPMPWDRISAARHRRYHDIAVIREELQERHDERAAEHPEFKYLTARSKMWDERRDMDKRVSLNKDKRSAMEAEWEKRNKALEALRKKPSPEAASSTDSTTEAKTKGKVNDPLLIEAALVLMDSMQLLKLLARN